jgi:hypothetical protein
MATVDDLAAVDRVVDDLRGADPVGGLFARDVGRYSGTLIVDFSSLPPGACQGAPVTGTGADLADVDISNDLVVAAAGANWPIKLTYGVANAAGAPDQFLIYACNPGNVDAVDPPAVSFRYMILGF